MEKVSLTSESKIFAAIISQIVNSVPTTTEEAQAIRNGPSMPLGDHIPRPNATVEKIELPTLTDNHPIRINVFRPKDVSADTILPALVFLPGGGWIVEGNESHLWLSGKLAADVKCAVFHVHYSLCPEVKFPVALEECYSVLSHLTDPEQAVKLNVDPTRVAIGGDSAGGNLCAAVTLMAKQRNELKNSIKFQILYYPVLGIDFETDSYNKFGNGYMLTKQVMKDVWKLYLGDSLEGNTLAIPSNATTEELAGLPPALIVTAEVDVLCSEGEAYGGKLLDAGVPVTSIRVHGVLHGFVAFPALYSNETTSIVDLTVINLKRIFA